MTNKDKMFHLLNSIPNYTIFNVKKFANLTHGNNSLASLKGIEREINNSILRSEPVNNTKLVDEYSRPAKKLILENILEKARKKRKLILFAKWVKKENHENIIAINDARNGRRWVKCDQLNNDLEALKKTLSALSLFEMKDIIFVPSGDLVKQFRKLVKKNGSNLFFNKSQSTVKILLSIYSEEKIEILLNTNLKYKFNPQSGKSHLDKLEAESIHIMREVMAEAANPVMLYSLGKDSSVMLHLAKKAFYPSIPPFPLLHIDTQWKFRAMYEFRDYIAHKSGMELLVYVNPEGNKQNINPFDHGSSLHTDIMKTQALKMALNHYKFDVSFGGARRDEEKSRAKERVFSFRSVTHQWDPKNQRPELWNLYNGRKQKDESIRVFPLSNWTELDIWQYIFREQIEIIPLYFAEERPVIERDGTLIMVDDDRLPLRVNETIQIKRIRFRTLGCYPLTGAIESDARDLPSLILELLNTRYSERQGRTIDTDEESSMEIKKKEGYF